LGSELVTLENSMIKKLLEKKKGRNHWSESQIFKKEAGARDRLDCMAKKVDLKG